MKPPFHLVKNLFRHRKVRYSGVMRPATGKVHRACALSGGVPPGAAGARSQRRRVVFLLADSSNTTCPLRKNERSTETHIAGRLRK